MMYMLSDYDGYNDEIESIIRSQSTDSQMIQIAAQIDFDFYRDIICQLEDSANIPDRFEHYVRDLHARGILDIDDYTIVFL